jgi:hypothetical protein
MNMPNVSKRAGQEHIDNLYQFILNITFRGDVERVVREWSSEFDAWLGWLYEQTTEAKTARANKDRRAEPMSPHDMERAYESYSFVAGEPREKQEEWKSLRGTPAGRQVILYLYERWCAEGSGDPEKTPQQWAWWCLQDRYGCTESTVKKALQDARDERTARPDEEPARPSDESDLPF